MFDCPEHTHTSPINTSTNRNVFFPVTVIVIDSALAGKGASFTIHLPTAVAVHPR